MTRTLVVTNDFPPRQGGIQTFVAALLATRPPESLVVLASAHPGAAAHDAALPYEVVRAPTGMLLPTRATARTAARLAREHGCRTAFFGAAAPLGALAPGLRRAGVSGPGDGRVVGLLLFLLALGTLVSAPVQNLVSRHIEARADRHALDLTEDPVSFVAVQRQLGVTNLNDPDPPAVWQWAFGSHPTVPQRIAFAEDWTKVHGG